MAQILLVTSDPALEVQIKQMIDDRILMTVMDTLPTYVQADQILMDVCSVADWESCLKQLDCCGVPIMPLCSAELFSQIVSSGLSLMHFVEKPVNEAVLQDRLIWEHRNAHAPELDSRIQTLWHQIAWGGMTPGKAYIHRRCDLLGIPPKMRAALPVYVHIKSPHPQNIHPERMRQISNLLTFKLRELEPDCCKHIIPMSPAGFLALFRFDGDVNYTRLNACAEKLAAFAEKALLCSVSCYIGRQTDISEIGAELSALVEQNKRNISDQPVMILHEGPSQVVQNTQYSFAPQHWIRYLYAYQFSLIVSEVQETLAQLETSNQLTRPLLEQLVQEFSQFLSVALHDFGIQASDLFDTERCTRLYNIAPESIDNTLNWVQYTIDLLSSYMHRQYAMLDPISRVVNYIDTHLSEDLNADILAEIAHFSKNYLGRAFKKQMQMSFQEYIRLMRIRYAENLLRDTDLPVGKIAEQVGYKSYASFHVQFRNVHRCAPQEFRKKAGP